MSRNHRNHTLVYLFIVVVGCFGFRVMKVVGSGKTQAPVPAPSAATVSCNVIPNTLCKPPIPVIGKTYTVCGLLKLINMNNSQGDSKFLILVTDSNGNPMGQQSTNANLALDSLITSNLNTQVTLQQDSALLQHLQQCGMLLSSNAAQYGKLLLFFQIPGNNTKFYLNQPYPAKVVAGNPLIKGDAGVNPANLVIQKWNFNATY